MPEGKVLILGSKGMLGGQLMKIFGNGAIGWDRSDCDVTDFESLKSKLEYLKPAAVINCVAYNDVDGAEENKKKAYALNAEVPASLGKICNTLDCKLVHVSSNYVFDGEKGDYTEQDLPHPLSIYAQSKYKGEQEIEGCSAKFYVIRTAVLFGPKGESQMSKKSFVDLMLGLSERPGAIKAVSDEINSLTYSVDLAGQIKLLLSQSLPYGFYHITNSGQASWYEFAKEIFQIAGKKVDLIPVSSSAFPRPAKRPKKSVLLNTKLPALRAWQPALRDFLSGSYQTIL
jgi:dTDP-4-dehydrorhamnose reductase